MPYPRLLPCGETALTIEFGNTIDARINDAVCALDAALQTLRPPVVETVPSYRSLLVVYDAEVADFSTMTGLIEAVGQENAVSPAARVWQVPVLYGGPDTDIDEFAASHGMSVAEVSSLHASALYLVYAIGFMPGFTYLGGLDPKLAAPRRQTPRASLPSGSVTIGGAQAAITSVEAPSGWHAIGCTPVQPFRPDRNPACLFNVGDFITFRAIARDEFDTLAQAAEQGAPIAIRIDDETYPSGIARQSQ